MKENKIEIAKIIIKVAGRELALSIEEAKDLQSLLNKTFGKEERIHYYPYWIPFPHTLRYGQWDVRCSETAMVVSTTRA